MAQKKAVIALLIVCISFTTHSSTVCSDPSYVVTQEHKADRTVHTLTPTSAPNSSQREQGSEENWPMAGGNPQRTSWSPVEIRGTLEPIWYKVIEPYIPPKVQIIAANGLLYVSTAKGLYALDADTGDTEWIYPTELPLGQAPTISGGVAYVGGFDRRLHAIDALTGTGIWTFEAEAGFETSPVVIELDGNTYVYAGNRDGYLYAIEDEGTAASLVWRHKTEGPVLFSPAYDKGVVYFASNDSHAYAVDARTGDLVWKSAKLPGAGFSTWWPVVYKDPTSDKDVIVLAGSNNYRHFLPPGQWYDLQGREIADIYEGVPDGNSFAPIEWDGSMEVTKAFEYFEEKPWRRTYFVLDADTGAELKFDYRRPDGSTGTSYAPILWFGTHSGNRHPPFVGSDGLLYQPMHYISNPYIAKAGMVGWQLGSTKVRITGYVNAMDEPIAYAGGGDLFYWNKQNDNIGGYFDYFTGQKRYYFMFDLDEKIPGYNEMYDLFNPNAYEWGGLYGGPSQSGNGVYALHGHQNPPIPYQNKVYTHRSNAVIAFGDYSGQPTKLPTASAIQAPDADATLTPSVLKMRLAVQVEKILDAGHLRPGYRSVGLFDNHTKTTFGDYLIDYWHNPSDTLYTLTAALPHLPEDLQQRVRTYIQNEYANYPPYQYAHVGWRDGAPREPFDLPQEIEADRINYPPATGNIGYEGWTWPPYMFYALWKYTETFGSARQVFDNSRMRLEDPPTDAYLVEYPYVHNAYIAGYWGYLELEALAGYPESASVRSELNRLLQLRVTTFDKDTPYTDGDHVRALSVARNFMFLVPELGQYLHDHALGKVEAAVSEYEQIAPYWFVANYDVTHGEGANQHFYDYHAMFQAKALILQESPTELTKYIDVPAVQVGDLFYIQNLIAALGAPAKLEKAANPTFGHQGDTITFSVRFSGKGSTTSITDTLPLDLSAPSNYILSGTSTAPTYDKDSHQLIWSDQVPEGQEIEVLYDVTITTDEPKYLVSTVELVEDSGTAKTDRVSILVNPHQIFAPIVSR